MGLGALLCLLPVTPALARSLRDLADCRFALISRISPDRNARSFAPRRSTAVSRLTADERAALAPSHEVAIRGQGRLSLSVRSPEEFLELARRLSRRGIWIVWTPSGDEARVMSGHFSVIAGEAAFTRWVDEAGPDAMRSFTLEDGRRSLGGFALAAAQFFELSEESVAALNRFFHDRVWNFHAREPGYGSRYAPLPFSRDAGRAGVENCATFAFSFVDPRWRALRPELERVFEEFGALRLHEIPNRQLFHNSRVASYRGTVLVTDSAEATREALRTHALREDLRGMQLFLEVTESPEAPRSPSSGQ